MRIALALTLLLLPLAGCLGGGDTSDQPPADPEPPGEDPMNSGTMGPSPDEDPLPPERFTCSLYVTVGLRIEGHGATDHERCYLQQEFGGAMERFQAAWIEVAWEDVGPTTVVHRFIIESDSCFQDPIETPQCLVTEAQGTASPVRLELSQEQLTEYGDDNLWIRARPEGLTVDVTYPVTATLFHGEPTEDNPAQ